MDRVRIFDRAGNQIDELRTTVARSWALVTMTSAQFRVPTSDTKKCTRYTLNFGNLVLVGNSDGLPDWVGVIDDQQFERDAVLITAFSPEVYFSYRRGPNDLLLSGSAGSIFRQMIWYINGLEETVLQAGVIESGGEMEESLNPVLLTDDLKRIVQRSGEGYRWRVEVVDGQLTVYGDWFKDLNLDTGLLLSDGYNAWGDTPLRQTSPKNDVLVYGSGGQTWNDRLKAVAMDADSRNEYGLRQVSISVQSPSQTTLDAAAAARLRVMKQPAPAFSLVVINVGGTFARILPGAAVTYLRLVGVGFSGEGMGYSTSQARVISMAYDPKDGVVVPVLRYEVKND